MCLESLTTDLYFTSDDYLYHKKCISKINYKSPITRQDFLYYLSVNKLVNDKVYFEKKTLKINSEKYTILMGLMKMDLTKMDLIETVLTEKELMNMGIIAIKN